MAETTTRILENKVALLTGAVRRNGRAMALRLAREGAAIVVNDRAYEDEGNAVVLEIEKLGGRGMMCLADITNEQAVQDMIVAIIDRFGRLDILVNNAGNRMITPFIEMNFQEWREIISIVLDGAFLCSRAAIPHMLRNPEGGTIINIGGVSGHTGAFYRAHVCTAAAGVAGLTKALAVEFAEHKITVNCIAPGRIGGTRSATSGQPAATPDGKGPLVGREGTFEEVAEMVCTLCLPTAKYITGQTIHINGGMFMI